MQKLPILHYLCLFAATATAIATQGDLHALLSVEDEQVLRGGAGIDYDWRGYLRGAWLLLVSVEMLGD